MITVERDYMNRNALRYAAVAAGFVASAPVLARALRWAYTTGSPRSVAPHADEGVRPPLARPRAWHEQELTRLSDLVQRARTGERSGRAHRVRSATAAYDDALLDSCRSIGVPLPAQGAPLADGARFDVETRLVAAGLSW